MQSKSVIDQKRVLWFTEEVKNSKRIMRRCEHLWRKYKHEDLWETFKTARNIFKNTLRKAKCKFYSNKIQDCGNDTRRLFQIINTLTGSNLENPMPECDDDQQLADEFAEFIAEKIDRIRSDLDHYPEYVPEHKDVPVMDKFLPIYQEEITETIFSMETKHCELDSIPTSVLKKLVPYIIVDITHVVNVSLSTGQFAIDWKCSCVNPLIKAMKLDRVKPSYHPVSNLSFISKLVECCALNQFNTHCNTHNLMPEYQSAYRRYHSCETSLINLTNSILWAMEKQEITSCILIDKSAAFDTIDRSILSEVLHHRFGISGTALSWYDSYLNDQQFYVKVRKTNSIKQPL